MPSIPHNDAYTPPWSIVPCSQFAGRFMIVDTQKRAVALGLSIDRADDWKRQLEATGRIDHDPI